MSNTSGRIFTPVGLVCFPSVFEPTSFQGSKPKFSLQLVFTMDNFTENDKQLWKKMLEAASQAAMAKFQKPLKDLPANFRRPWRDGAEKADLQGFGEGTRFITISSMQRPGLVDLSGNPIMDQHEFYAGCLARATVSAYAYDTAGNRGVAFGLQNIQKVADGSPLDGRTDAGSDFSKAPEAEFVAPATPASSTTATSDEDW